MNRVKVHSAVTIVVFASLVVIVSLAARTGRGQSQNQKDDLQKLKSESLVKPTVLATDRAVVRDATTSSFNEAAAQNFVLRNELTWTFGSKQQHGWYLYDLLIGQTLNAQPAAATPDFASAVSTWQKQRGLNANGVLDENSWMALVAQWQADRLRDKTPANPDQLLTAPPSEFFDPERLPELRQVERTTYAAYKAMLAAAIADPTLNLAHTPQGELEPAEKYFKIVSAFRSREYQEQLRRQSPGAGSAGLAINSPHFTGRALDLYVGGDPVDTKDSNRAIQVKTPAYQWLVRNAARFGFRPYFYEPWHWEYVK
ncbi:MAG: D-alanyl-D-alanine carboxypeptidase family protein [Pyrinomonadaceae bacterium]